MKYKLFGWWWRWQGIQLIDNDAIIKRVLLSAFLALQVLDVLTTIRFLANGNAVEANPVMIFAMDRLGPWWWIIKIAMVLVVVPILARGRVRYVAAICGLYAITVVNNLIL
jgi:hypothetical protein